MDLEVQECNQVFFKIIIPNYNNDKWILKSLQSVLDQTFSNFHIIVIDDCSTDNSIQIINSLKEKDNRITLLTNINKVWNGGARNQGILYNNINSQYTLFLDSDDWFKDKNCLFYLYNLIQNNNNPDCISLSYDCLIGNNSSYQFMNRNTPKELVSSLYVACWTKCIKTSLIQLFPENTLMEDVVQHIKQADKINNIITCDKSIVVWNRNNIGSCSRVENQNLQQGKWQSSMYRYAADLMDLKVEHDYCEEHRKWRLQVVLQNIKEGKYIQ